jgi:hypothetical protein
VWNIHQHQVAGLALVEKRQHWVVVKGYDASAPPTSSTDLCYSISSFDIYDPSPMVPPHGPNPTLPPPHGDKDGCGTGGTPSRGIIHNNIDYQTWLSDYLNGVPKGITLWGGHNVAICDPDPAPTRMGKQPPAPQRFAGDRIITPDDAKKSATDGMKLRGLYDRDPWKSILAGTSAAQPLLVQRLDRRDSFYFIVPMQTNTPPVTFPALASIDARFGNYLQACAVANQSQSALSSLSTDPQKALNLVVKRHVRLPRPHGRLLVREEAANLNRLLVWRPCRESFSPFYPFFMVTVGSDRIYIRVDGQVFTKLHTRDGGI